MCASLWAARRRTRHLFDMSMEVRYGACGAMKIAPACAQPSAMQLGRATVGERKRYPSELCCPSHRCRPRPADGTCHPRLRTAAGIRKRCCIVAPLTATRSCRCAHVDSCSVDTAVAPLSRPTHGMRGFRSAASPGKLVRGVSALLVSLVVWCAPQSLRVSRWPTFHIRLNRSGSGCLAVIASKRVADQHEAMVSYEPRWLGITLAGDGHGADDFVFKAVIYTDGAVFWELRLLFAAMLYHRRVIQTWKLLARERQAWQRSFAEVGLALDNELKSSKSAAKLRDPTGGRDHDPKQRAEFTLSTKGVVAVLLCWYGMRHRRDERVRASEILLQLAQRLVVLQPNAGDCIGAFACQSRRLCRKGAQADGDDCNHLAGIMSGFDTFFAAPSAKTLVGGILGMEAGIVQGTMLCAASASFRQRIVAFVADLFDKSCPNLSRCDALAEQTPALGCARKRPRIDEDLRRAVVNTVVREGRASSGAAWARATGSVAGSSCGRWEQDEMKAYLAAANKLLGDGVSVVSIVEDASRIGDPAEDTMVYLAWSGKHDTGFYPPVQVFWGRWGP